jgi:hypothetical protein
MGENIRGPLRCARCLFEERILSVEDDLYEQRIGRIAEIEALGFQPYGHRFDFTHTIPQVLAEYGDKTRSAKRNTRSISCSIWAT